MSFGKDVSRGLTGNPGSDIERGTCLSVDWATGLVTVNIAGGRRVLRMAGPVPTPGDQVWVGTFGGIPLCLGPLPKASTGTVLSAPAGGKVAVKTDDGGEWSLPYNFDHATFAAQQRVAIDWDSGTVAYRLSSDPTIVAEVIAPTPPASAASSTVTREFAPTGSGSFYTRTGTWTKNDVWCSDTLIGCYFYGTQIADTIPDNARIDAVTLHVAETTNSYPSSLATFGTHGLSGRTGAPAVSNAIAVPNGSGGKSLPTSFGDALKTGAQLGIGTNRGGLHVFGTAPNSGRLVITYTT